MFPSRFFPDRYFAPRYWPKVGADTPVVSGAGMFCAAAAYSVAGARAADYSVAGARAATYSVAGARAADSFPHG